MFADLAHYLALDDRQRPRRQLRHWMPSLLDVEAGLERRQFVPVFQLRVQPRDGALHSVQATVRWCHPQRGRLAPSAFLCEADQYGLLEQVAEQLMRHSLSVWRDWHDGGAMPRLSLHLSGAVLRTAGMARRFNGLLAAAGIDSGRVDFEADAQPSVLLIDACRMRDASATARAVLAQQVARARAEGRTVIADGVDGLLEWTLARELGCDVAQGDFIAAPLSLRHLRAALRFWRDSHRAISAIDSF